MGGRPFFRGATLLGAAAAMVALHGLAPLHAQNVPPDTAESESEDDALPLEATRALRYTATEGTWISLDVSPDGRTIVFDFLGDLYTLPIVGGQTIRLTDGLAFDGQPRFSPDGSRIVFTSDRSGGENLWIMALDGSDTTQVTEGKNGRYQSPEWTPDGEYIVASKTFLRIGVPKLHMYHIDGGSGVPVIDEPEDIKTLGPAFGDDPRYIWFARREGNWEYNAVFPQYQLAVYDRETGEIYQRSSRYGSGFRPTLSPDGRWLVYGTRHDEDTGLRIRDLRTGEERWLLYPVQHDDQESRATRDVLPGMSFTPDSEALITFYGGQIWRVPIGGGAPERIPFTIDVDVALGPEVQFDYTIDDSPTFTVRQIRGAVPSPDGGRLAFSALDRLYVMDYPEGEPERLTDTDVSEQMPAWSPDGRWIAYVTWDGREGHIYRIRADGSGSPERLTTSAGFYREPVWSPDGERIVAIRSAAQTFQSATGPRGGAMGAELIWIPGDGGDATTVAPTEGRGAPHFADDADRIYLTGGDGELLSMRWDGTDLREHVRVTGPTQPGDDDPAEAEIVLMSPTGDRALAKVLNDLYVVTVPLVGGETPEISVADPEDAAFPAWKITDVGGEFPAWATDGQTVHFSLGDAHFVYDLERAREVRDSLEAEARAEAEGAAEGEGEEYRAAETRILIQAPRDIPESVAVLRGGRAITMRGDEIIEDADIVVRDNRIIAVGPRGSVDVPADAEVIDISGTTVIPGFVDTHAHLRPAWGVHKRQVWPYLANLAYGVTTTRDPQTGTTDVLTYADRVRTGEIIGPRIFSTGPGVFASDPPEDLDDARDILRRYSEYYDTKSIMMYVAG
ncbi:MAG: amidohydrolase family protein [Longimicrobiales bacterium]